MQFAIKFRELEGDIFSYVGIKYERKHWCHRVNCGVAYQQPTLRFEILFSKDTHVVDSDGSKVKERRKYSLDKRDDKASVNDELSQRC